MTHPHVKWIPIFKLSSHSLETLFWDVAPAVELLPQEDIVPDFICHVLRLDLGA